MSLAIDEWKQVWTKPWMKRHPVRTFGISLHIVLRTLFALFWLAAGINKLTKGWLSSDILKQMFLDRLTEMPPDAFAVFYLQAFAIPLHMLVAWVVTVGELYSAIGLLLGLTTRISAAVAFFILVNLGIGGYYDASLIPFFLLSFAFLWWSSGRWFGLDRYLLKRYPDSRLFS